MKMLSDAKKYYRRLCSGNSTKEEGRYELVLQLITLDVRRYGASTLRMAVHLRHNDSTEVCAFLECLTLSFSSLT